MKKITALILIFSLLACSPAGAETVGGNCGLNGGNNVKWRLDLSSGELVIYGSGVMADYIRTYPPRPAWLQYGDSIESVRIEEGVTSVGMWAFGGLSRLKSVKLPASITDIRDRAFMNTGIEAVELPEGLSHIGEGAFACTKIKSVTVPVAVKKIEADAFCESPLEEATFSEGLEEIGEEAFRKTALKKISLPDSLETLARKAFSECTALASADLGDGLESIGYYAFEGCTALTRLRLPKGLEEIGMGAFSDCASLSRVELPASLKVIGGSASAWNMGAFSGTAITEIALPAGLVEIGGHAFQGAPLKSVYIPDSVAVLGDAAFRNCAELESVRLPAGLKRLGADMFYGCTALSAVELPEGLEEIGGEAFMGTGCSEVYLPKSVRDVSSMSFGGAPLLRAVRVDSENPSYYDVDGVLFSREGPTLVFYPGARSARDYAIPEGTAAVGYDAFGSGADGIVTLHIPASVTDFDPGAFKKAASLREYVVNGENPAYKAVDGVLMSRDGLVLISYPRAAEAEEYTVPAGVREIGDNAFYGALNLRKLTIPEGVIKLGLWTFSDCAALEELSLPRGLVELPQDMTAGCASLTKLKVPEGVTTIGPGAVNSSVVRLELPESLEQYHNNFSMNTGARALILPDGVSGIYNSGGTDFLCHVGTITEETLKRGGACYVPSVIKAGEASVEAATLVRSKELEINSVTVTALSLPNGRGLYVRESELKLCGFAFNWDEQSHTTTVIPPKAVSWSPESEWRDAGGEAAKVLSSDVRFIIDGFTVPSLNIGGGESALEINSLAGAVLY